MQFLKIPEDRVAVVIGKSGEVKSQLEALLGVPIELNSETGDITIDDTKAKDPLAVLKVLNVLKAIGRGFAPEKAFRLTSDDTYFELLDIRDYVGKDQKHVRRMKSRIIGTNGKTRQIIEELTGVNISIYGNTVGLIGEIMNVGYAKTACDMILNGSEHSTVYNFLENKRKELKSQI